MHVYLHILHAHTKFCQKQMFFVAYTKEIKNMSQKGLFSTKFCQFYIDNIKSRYFLKQFTWKRRNEDIHKTYLFILLFQICQKNK
jgi:hypothetical protein